MNTEIRITEDGSHTLFVPRIDECYHSTHGAIQESQHIFIEEGLKKATKKSLRILEIGFGTGLNALLTLTECIKSDIHIDYTTLEKYPLDGAKACLLNYPELIAEGTRTYFEQLHNSEWNKAAKIAPNFCFTKIKCDFTEFEFSQQYDVVYFDAFSPDKQPEMWSEQLFKEVFDHCNDGAILTTYCAKGYVRRAMQHAGFMVERIPGPPGKREILRARVQF